MSGLEKEQAGREQKKEHNKTEDDRRNLIDWEGGGKRQRSDWWG